MFVCLVLLSQPSNRDLGYLLWNIRIHEIDNIPCPVSGNVYHINGNGVSLLLSVCLSEGRTLSGIGYMELISLFEKPCSSCDFILKDCYYFLCRIILNMATSYVKLEINMAVCANRDVIINVGIKFHTKRFLPVKEKEKAYK